MNESSGSADRMRQNAVPPTREERDRLLGLIREYARNHPPVPPLSVSELAVAADAILSQFAAGDPAARVEANEKYRHFVAVLFSNEAWRETVAAVPCERRLLLLPKCLRAEGRCAGTLDEIGLVCEDCGQCPISGLKKEAARLGYAVLVAEGAPVVLSIVRNRKIEAVVGVSCLTALERIYPLMQSAAIPGIAIPLLYDGCASTAVDLDWVREAIRLVGSARTTRMNLNALRDEVEGWFSNAALQETLGPATTETERIARTWLAKSGKRWRPLLAAGAYEALGGRRASASDTIRKVALAVECFHKASLVHDDIEDEDALRYGERTLHEEYGVPVALNAGDFLLGEGYRMIAESGLAPERVAEMLRAAAGGHRDLAIGQGLELCWTRHPGPLRSADVLDIFRRKTAPAFEVALRLGAVAAGADDGVWDILGRYSTALGMAYQIRDDLKDWDGKAEPDDAGAMRPSILLAIAHERAEGDDRRCLQDAWRRSLRPAATAERVRAILTRLNAQPEARRLLSLYMNEAIRCLEATSSHDLKALLRHVIFKIFSDVTQGSLPGESEVGTAPGRAASAGPAA